MRETALTVVSFLFLTLILWLANLAERRRVRGKPNHWPAGIGLGLLAAMLVLFALSALLMFGMSGLLALLGSLPASAELQGLPAPDPMLGIRLGLPLFIISLLGLLLLLPPLRRLLARLIPIDPLSTVHAVALSFAVLIPLNLLITLAVGLDNVVASLEASPAEAAATSSPAFFWTQELLFALMGLVGVGWLSRRRLGEALKRLGLTLPSLRQVGAGLGIGLGMVGVIWLAERVTGAAGIAVNPEVEKLNELLTGPLASSLFGVLTIGLAAAIGEETLFRGALQPRFGLLLTAMLFTLVHSQYGLSLYTLFVFVGGLVLGLVRQRANTSTSMIVHAVYNIVGVLLPG